VVVAVRDEVEHLARCLRSLEPLEPNEVIVMVDDRSRRDTAEVAQRYGASVFIEPWRGYSAQKNAAIERASEEWILSLDADEEMSAELCREIQDVLNHPQVDGYAMPRRTRFLEHWISHGGWYPDHQLRLFRKDKGRFNERKRVHEGVVLDGPPGRLSHHLLHTPYQNLEEYVRKLEEYTSLAVLDLRDRGVQFRGWHLIVHPSLVFVKAFVLRKGWLDGRQGFAIAALSAMNAFFKYAKLWERREDPH